MAIDKVVDSGQLDSDLTSIANAIRTKGGTSASLAFPSGFVTAIDTIPSGGGETTTVFIDDSMGTIGHGIYYVDSSGVYRQEMPTLDPDTGMITWSATVDVGSMVVVAGDIPLIINVSNLTFVDSMDLDIGRVHFYENFYQATAS